MKLPLLNDQQLRELMDRSFGSYRKPNDARAACESVLTRLQQPGTGNIEDPLTRFREEEPETASDPARPVGRSRRWQWPAIVAAVATVAIAVILPTRILQGAPAVLEDAEGKRSIQYGELVRPVGDMSAMLSLTDGSHIEMRSMSEFSLERTDDGIRIRLEEGGLIADAPAKNRVYVQTKDINALVSGGVSLVKAEERGSRIAAISGEIHVQQGTTENRLRSGEQVATSPDMEWVPVEDQVAWSRHAAEHIALLTRTATTAVRGPVAISGETPPSESSELQSQMPQASLTFEVASIKPSEARTSVVGGCRGQDGIYVVNSISPEPPLGRCVFSNGTLKHMVSFAYSPWPAPLPLTVPVSGGPDWLNNDRFKVEAKSPDALVRVADLQQMLQKMLAERFKLAVHYDFQSASGYALVVSRGGPRLHPANSNESESISGIPTKVTPPSVGTPTDRTITIKAQHYPLSKLADILSRLGPGPVEDKSDLAAPYDFTLTWNEATGPTLFTALREQLGLQLEPQKVQVKTIVIDRAEKPQQN